MSSFWRFQNAAILLRVRCQPAGRLASPQPPENTRQIQSANFAGYFVRFATLDLRTVVSGQGSGVRKAGAGSQKQKQVTVRLGSFGEPRSGQAFDSAYLMFALRPRGPERAPLRMTKSS
jgi:hypothetical protein